MAYLAPMETSREQAMKYREHMIVYGEREFDRSGAELWFTWTIALVMFSGLYLVSTLH